MLPDRSSLACRHVASEWKIKRAPGPHAEFRELPRLKVIGNGTLEAVESDDALWTCDIFPFVRRRAEREHAEGDRGKAHASRMRLPEMALDAHAAPPIFR